MNKDSVSGNLSIFMYGLTLQYNDTLMGGGQYHSGLLKRSARLIRLNLPGGSVKVDGLIRMRI